MSASAGIVIGAMVLVRFDDEEWAPLVEFDSMTVSGQLRFDIRELEVGSELGILISLQAERISSKSSIPNSGDEGLLM
jgi:hypothetical protein